MASELAEFISNVKTGVQQLEELHRRPEPKRSFESYGKPAQARPFARLALIPMLEWKQAENPTRGVANACGASPRWEC